MNIETLLMDRLNSTRDAAERQKERADCYERALKAALAQLEHILDLAHERHHFTDIAMTSAVAIDFIKSALAAGERP